MTRKIAIFVAMGAALLVPAALAIAGSYPTVLAPRPLAVFLPVLIGASRPLALSVGPLAFWLVGARVLCSGRPLYLFSIFLSVLTLGNVAWFAAGWRYALEWQGVTHVVSLLAINLAFAGVLWALWFAWRRTPGLFRALALCWLGVAWLVSFALPYLGESP